MTHFFEKRDFWGQSTQPVAGCPDGIRNTRLLVVRPTASA